MIEYDDEKVSIKFSNEQIHIVPNYWESEVIDSQTKYQVS
jgi:hypothetical protein